MTVVADAGPLIHLSLVGRVDLLPLLYGRILVPDLVHQEVVQKGEGDWREAPKSAWLTGSTFPRMTPERISSDC